MKVVCINDSKRPNQIPAEKWPVKGKPYTVIKAVNMGIQKNVIGFALEEISLEGCFPYEYYNADRFLPEEFYQKNIKVEEVEEELALI
jgi:hypothetical protein